MRKPKARRVADYILAFSHEHGDPISNLKLQKLLYYAQGWHLALHGVPLFDERIEAWAHGPVVPPVYGDFKGWAWKPIDYDPGPNGIDLEDKEIDHLIEVMEVYGGFSAIELEQMTHRETPWIKARRGLPADEPCNEVINHADMSEFFRREMLKDGPDQGQQA